MVGTDWKSDLDRAANRFQKIIEGQVANNLGNNKLLEASAVKKEAGLAWDEENKLHGRNDNAIATQMNWASRRKTEEKSVEEMTGKRITQHFFLNLLPATTLIFMILFFR